MILEKIYKQKLDKFHMSKDFLIEGVSNGSGKIATFLHYSNTKDDMRNNIEGELYNSNDFFYFDFSYLLGLEFGVYNLYRFEEISPTMKKRIVLLHPSREETILLFQNHKKAIGNVLKKEYPVDDFYIEEVMSEMFEVQTENKNYTNEIAIELGRLTTAFYLYFQKYDKNTSPRVVDYFFESGHASTYFQNWNGNKKRK